MAATGNQLKGKGVEDAGNYDFSTVIFCNIGNIHVMRDSLNSFADVVLPNSDSTNVNFYSKLEESGWLRNVRLVLSSSVLIAELMRLDSSSLLGL